MAGFNNDVMYADNVDFTGNASVSASVTADGQLLIGSTVAPNIRVGLLTSLGGSISITVGAGTINLETGATTPITFMADSGAAVPAGNILNVFGTNSISTSGTGNTLTITVANASAVVRGVASFDVTNFTVTGGNVVSNPITITAGAGITVVGSPVNLGGAVTISAAASVPTTFTADVGTATPAANNINLLGTAAQGLSTSATGSTVTFTNADWTTTQKGVGTLATNAETITGAVTNKAVTPDDLKAKLGTQTIHSLALFQGQTAALTSLGAATNGQIPIGSTGADPVLNTLTAGANVTITNGAGTITIAAAGGGSGTIIQQVRNRSSAVASVASTGISATTVITTANTTSLSTLAITPTNIASIIRIDVTVPYTNNGTGSSGFALFQGTTLLSAYSFLTTPAGSFTQSNVATFTYYQVAGTTSALTFDLRIFSVSGGGSSTFINQTTLSAPLFGGTSFWTYIITETTP